MSLKTERSIFQSSMKRVGILGGTFDPVHFGHLIIAKRAKSSCKLDEIWFMPAKSPPHKRDKHVSDFYLREAMIKLAIKDIPYFSCSDFENNLEGDSYTFKTLEKLYEGYRDVEFFFIMGADSFYELESWKNPEIILKKARLIIVSRDYQNENMTLKKHYEYLKSKYTIREIYFIDTVDIDISSREIREDVRQGKDIGRYVPEDVLEFIKEKKLYEAFQS